MTHHTQPSLFGFIILTLAALILTSGSATRLYIPSTIYFSKNNFCLLPISNNLAAIFTTNFMGIQQAAIKDVQGTWVKLWTDATCSLTRIYFKP
jgi:hypothetical protein